MKPAWTVIYLLSASILYAQKTAYIPAYLLNPATVDGQQFSWTKTAQSDNFTIIWGDAAGEDPGQASDFDLRFSPEAVLDTMEIIYQVFVEFGFAQDEEGTKLRQYKIPIVMLNTFGPTGVTGWAFGGDADGVIGAFWAHPLAMQTGHVAAHEFAHSLQAQSVLDFRTMNGFGPVWNNAGIFWESHANFMRNLLYPQDVTAWGMDVYHIETWGDWKNTYENYAILYAIMESEGIEIINRLWRESFSNEYPLQAYKRLMNYDQTQFNDKMYDYARRMANYDFAYSSLGHYFRQYRQNDLVFHLPSTQATYTILEQDSSDPKHFVVPIELAPEEFAYNIIPIYPDPDSCAVILKFKGHSEVNAHAGWRYGFVATLEDGTVSRYSVTYSSDSAEIGFALEGMETGLFLVVMGAPKDNIQTNPSNDTWQGYPKHFRYPYEISLSGGLPEGFQASGEFRKRLKNNGHLHPNGGGWIANTSSVSSTVYVAPHAMVLGQSDISGNVRILNTALVKDAILSDEVVIKDNAFILRGSYSDNAIISGQAFSENNTMWDNAHLYDRAKVSNYSLHGDIEVGGDVVVYNTSGDCDNGVYYRMTNYYQDNLLECDNRTSEHPDNKDVNQNLTTFQPNQVSLNCKCANYPDCLIPGLNTANIEENILMVYPNPADDRIMIKQRDGQPFNNIRMFDVMGKEEMHKRDLMSHEISLDVSNLPAGLYIIQIESENNKFHSIKISVQ